MKKLIVLPVYIVVVSLFAVMTGCSQAVQEPPAKNEEVSQASNSNEKGNIEEEQVMDEFQKLVGSSNEVSPIVDFMDKNISKVSRENASIMLITLETKQKEYLPILEEKFNNNLTTQQSINTVYTPQLNIDGIKNQELKDFLLAVKNSGYKVETAEGMYFPVIDYQFYSKYKMAATNDIKEYFTIMEVESNEPPAKDAALMIGWNEIIQRALNQEKFLVQYPNSSKAEDIKNLYNKYVSFTLFGTNNTPLFLYENNQLVADAHEAFTVAYAPNERSEYLSMIKGYLEVIKSNNFALTDEVKAYREQYTK